jgi:transcriptional regulator with PAS, ATPase and Fis domain
MSAKQVETRTWTGNAHAAKPQDPIGLVVLSYANAEIEGAFFGLSSPVVFGRRQAAEVSYGLDRDPHVSRVHVRVTADGPQRARVEDLGSRNGTYVNGQRVTAAVLTPGDLLRVGGTLFEYGRPGEAHVPGLVGRSAALARAASESRAYAPAAIPVLLLGETGTGKEAFAHHLHDGSGRAGAFVAVNCAAIPEQLFEATLFGHQRGAFTGAVRDNEGMLRRAAGGTLFLDEIGELPLGMQAKLLRVLETGDFFSVGGVELERADARIIAATNADLSVLVEQRRFREDLLHRIAQAQIVLAPLRERRLDVLPLARMFAARHGVEALIEWEPSFIEKLHLHAWPGNARELGALIHRLGLARGARPEARCVDLLGEMTGATLAPPRRVDDAPGEPDAEALRQALARFAGSVADVARHFGRHRKQIYTMIQRAGIDPDHFRTGKRGGFRKR